MQGLTVAVTGATGFVGSHLAMALVRAGIGVRGVVRAPERGAWLAAHGVELVPADLLDPDALERAFRGCAAVVSNAALGSNQGDLAAFERVNQQGTSNVLRATTAAGVGRLVQISTVAVYRTRLYVPMDEDAPGYDTERRRWNWSDLTTDWRYARTKTRAEQLCWAHAREHDLALTVLRPAPVYGSRDPKVTARFLAQLDRAVVFAPTVGVPFVHAADVAEAAVAALRNPDSVGRAYNLAGPPVSPRTLLHTLKQLTGRGPVVVPVPVPVSVRYDTGAAARDLGFQARSLVDGLREALSEPG